MAQSPKLEKENAVLASIQLMVPQYLAKRRLDLARIHQCLAAGEFKEIAMIGHNMKGTGQGFGLPAVSVLGADLEAAAKAEDVAGIEHESALLQKILDQMRNG